MAISNYATNHRKYPLNLLLQDIGWLALVYLLLVAFATSMIHGATGIAGGFLLAVAAAPILGIKAIVPVLSITMLISHGSRAIFNLSAFNKPAFVRVVVPAFPCVIGAALIYGKLSSAMIAFLLGGVVLLSVPLRRWTSAREIKTTPRMLCGTGAIYGMIAGAAIGPGTLLAPVLLGLGIGREAFVATLAAIALTTNITRTVIYGFSDLLNEPSIILGILTGIATIPGAWIGRSILRKLTDKRHALVLEWLLVLGGINFFWAGYKLL